MSFPTFQIIITLLLEKVYIALHFFSSQFKENFRSETRKGALKQLGNFTYLCVCLFYSTPSLLQKVRLRSREVKFLTKILTVINSRTVFSVHVLKFVLQLILLHILLLLYIDISMNMPLLCLFFIFNEKHNSLL